VKTRDKDGKDEEIFTWSPDRRRFYEL